MHLSGRRVNIHYSIMQFFYWGLFTAYYAFGASYLYSLGLTSGVTGLVLAATGLLSALLQPCIATVADRSPTLHTKALALLVAAPAFLLLLLCLLLSGKASVGVMVALYGGAWLLLLALQFLISSFGMEYAAAGIPLNFGTARAVGSLGYALLSYLMGILSARLGLTVLLPFSAAMALLLLLSLCLWKPLPKAVRQESDAPVRGGFFRRYPRFLLFLAGSILAMTAYCMCCNFLVRIVENLGGGSEELGTAVMIAALCEIPTIFLSLHLRKRFGSGRLMRVAAVMLAVKAALLYAATSIPFLYCAMLSQLLSYALFIPISVYYVDGLMGQGDKVRGQALMTFVPTVGTSVGSLIGGALLDRFGVSGMLLFCVVCSVVGAGVMLLGTEKVD